jgi:transcriptional regulator with XRE-family HTH domain
MNESENKLTLELWITVKELRKKSWLTQLQLSEQSWVARSYISDIEKGKAKVTYAKIVIILDILGYWLDIAKKRQW